MKFSRLKLHGFKSFCDEMTLVMEPGLTGIVGPNGCGKSNLVEAMRWVMGESSYKAMRASGMDDVIFSGSASRPARNTAEVTLILDNSDRTAPAALNTADVLEITRRIEREAGSVYRVNGRDVRARDVQLLFADASTGAHSPAMVRQGQIGELIAAKPTARRALLEEAAGISGLHSRRHEAELRLRATETNLARIDDVIGQIEAQLDTLRRQARLALRYRSISGDIRRTEATLFHLRWVAARFAENDAEASHAILVRELAAATHAAHLADAALVEAEARLQPLRERAAIARAAAQRYSILYEQLADEARRAAERKNDLDGRLHQLAADGARERELLAEAEAALAAISEEMTQRREDQLTSADNLERLRTEAELLHKAVTQAEIEARRATDALSQLRAHSAEALRSRDQARGRTAKAESELAKVTAEAQSLTSQIAADEAVALSTEMLKDAQVDGADAEASASGAEEAVAQALVRLENARQPLAETELGLGRLEAEAATLVKLVTVGSGEWASVADRLNVTPGYETALGAALGDDLEVGTDPSAPLYWSPPLDRWNDPALPQAAEPLSRYVTGDDTLKRRLDQVGLIDPVDGPALMHSLKPGQRLVTLEGALWRWDGFIAAADASTAAAQRLAHRNRLAELDEDIMRLRAERVQQQRHVQMCIEALENCRQDERLARERLHRSRQAIGSAQQRLTLAERAVNEMEARTSALGETIARLEALVREARSAQAAAESSVTGAEEEAKSTSAAEAAQLQATTARQRADNAKVRFAEAENATRQHALRLAQLEQDSKGWVRRRDGALAQLSTLDDRRAALTRERDTLRATPDGFNERKARLESQIAVAQVDQRVAEDELNIGETAYRVADRTSRAAAQALGEARIAASRLEERIKGLAAQRQQIERQVEETLGIAATQTLEASGIRPADKLPGETAVEQKLERLRAERERLGGVNLSAEAEAVAAQDKYDALVADKTDLVEAIAKLRSAIASLNREGRSRLNDAFLRVNTHFQELFTTLFGGGTAELTFIESDDPLEAGLEIIARPPGKKPQTMTLLSGGEQALTAMSLIFAVFLTNPAPICVLDEVDAPLDDANVERFCNLLDSMRERTDTRFMVITHNPITMSRVDRLFGVTMAERGVSQLVSVDLHTAESFRDAS
jgi:chromosome segregation protein